MANYTPTFSKPYPSGWADKPSKTTPVTAAIMNSYDTAIAALESYLRDNAIDTVSVNVEQFPSDGREWLGTITVGNNQYKIYMPSLKYENSVSDGIKIGTITLGKQSFDVYAPSASSGGSNVSVVPKTLTGTNIAEITVDGTTYQLYAPTSGGGSGSNVTAEATLTEGAQIGKITIDGTETILYAPTASAITVDAELSATSENAIQNKVVKAEFDQVNSNLTELKVSDVAGGKNLVLNTVYGFIAVDEKVNIDNSSTSYIFYAQAGKTYSFSGDATPTAQGVRFAKVSSISPETQETVSDFNLIADGVSTFTTNETGYYMLYVYNTKTSGIKFQIEEGTTATDYEPYIPSIKMLADENAQQSTDLSNLKDGTTPVAKAVADEDGNDIKSTYAKKTEAFIDYSHISVDLNTLTAAPSLISIGYEAANKPSGFYGGYMFVVNAGYSASIALYQTLLDVFSNKTYQRKYYHDAWTDWQETNSSSAGITIDSALSVTSENPVQNKVVTTKFNEVFQSVSSGKSLVASAITDKGITTATDATFQVMATNIGKISVSGSAEASNPLSMIGNYNFQSKIVLADGLSADNIAITKDSTNIQITSVAKTSDTKFKVTGDFSAISAGDVIKVQTNPGFFFDSNLRSISDVSVVMGDPQFLIKEPQLDGSVYLTLLYKQGYLNYYATKRAVKDAEYWTIGLITYCGAYTVPLIVSDVSEHACVTSTYMNGAPTATYTFVYDEKTYYCNANVQGAQQSSVEISNLSIPLYDVHDSNYTDNEAGCVYMAKKLLDFYFRKEALPQ